METYSLIFLLLCLFTTATSEGGGICDLVYCGQGTCNLTLAVPFFECNCFPGWTKIQIGPLTFPACLLPNYTTNLQCGNGSPPPPPAVPLPPPPLNFSDPCNLVWCGEGSCITNGTSHKCECNEGSDNLIGNPELPCFKACFLGADCTNLGLLPPPSPPPENSGWTNGMNLWKCVGVLIFIFLTNLYQV